jgi:hypothetical protein
MRPDPVGDYDETKAMMDEAIMSYRPPKSASSGAFPLPAGYGDMPSGGDMKTNATIFASTVEDVPSAAPRRREVPAGVGSFSGTPKAEAAPDDYFGTMRISEVSRAPVTSRSLKRGTFNNDDVRALQFSLKDISAFMGDKSLDPGAVDSDFGGNTENAVKAFQSRFGLEPTGVVDADTMGVIRGVQTELAMGRMDKSGTFGAGPAAAADFTRSQGSPYKGIEERNIKARQMREDLSAARKAGVDQMRAETHDAYRRGREEMQAGNKAARDRQAEADTLRELEELRGRLVVEGT